MKRSEAEKLFVYEHLPTHLQTVSQNFHSLAMHIIDNLQPSAERTLALRNLWDAKNYAVWCAAQEQRK